MAQRAPLEAVRSSRIPPHNLDAEQSVLGAMLESKDAIANVVEVLKPEDFYKPAHSLIYETILALNERGEAADAITVADELKRRGSLDSIGGKPYIHGLLEAYPTASSAGYYARIIEEHSLLRQLVEAGGKVQEIGFSMPEDVVEAIDEAEELVYNVGDKRLKDDYSHIRPLLTKSMSDIEALYERGEHITGLASGFPDLDDMTSGWQPSNLIIVAARPSMGKCACADTLVDDPDTGERLTIKGFVRRRVSSVSGIGQSGAIESLDVSDWVPNGIRPCLRVRTRTGRSIEVTDNHPFLTVDGWVPLSDLQVGRKVVVARKLEVFGTDDSWSLERVRLLAYYIAEGGLTGNIPGFTNVDPVIVADFTACIDSEFPDCSLRTDGLTYRPRARVRRKRPNSVTQWLRDLDLMGKSALQKRFPGFVWCWPKQHLTHFLRTLFSCDGTVYSMGGYARIEFTVASEKLAEDVHHALVRFGIVSKLWQKTARSWRVEITEPESVQVYQREIGWIGQKSERMYIDSDVARRSNCGHLPPEAWTLVRKALDARGMSLSELARRSGEAQNLHTRRGLPQRRLEKYAEILDNDDLRWLASPDFYWDEIVEITPVGPKPVYDLTVPMGSNFVAQDICVHNSSLLNDFVLHATTRTKVPVVIFSLEMSRDELVKRFLSSEAKVDSQRISKGSLQEQDWTRLSSALGRLAEAPIFIDDSANITLMEMRAKCRRLKAKHGLGLVIVDYLQLMQSPRKSENRQQEVSEISRSLKIMARDLQVPVICASQLNRMVETRSDKRPLLGDLRESGCLTGETEVTLANGRNVPIASLVGKQPDVVTLDGWHMTTGRAVKVWRTGRRPVFRVTTATGREIVGTGNHRFLKFDGWEALDAFRPGDRVALPRAYPTTSKEPWDADRLILLAHLIGDGCYASGQPIHYTSMSPANLDAVAESARKAFGVEGRRVAQESWWHLYLSAGANKWHPNPIRQWLRDVGIDGQRSSEKLIPADIFGLPSPQIGLFLRHLWATDGCVWVRTKGKGPRGVVYYGTSSRRLATGVQELLGRLGIVGRVKVSCKKGYGPSYQVHVYGRDQQLRFGELVGGHGPKATVVEELAARLTPMNPNLNSDTIPVEVWSKVKDRMTERGISQRAMAQMRGTSYGGSSHFRFSPTREVLNQYAGLLDDSELKEIASSDLYWDTVVSVEPCGEEDVYDMTVPGTHNFVANGLVTHNSIEQDSDLVMFIYRDEVYNPESEARGEAELHVAKHRNGPTGTVRLAFMNQYTKFASIAKAPGR